jgi:hypothetical protein
MTNNVEEKPKRKIPLWVFIGIGLIFLCFCMIVFGFGLSRLLKSFDGELPFGLGDAGGPLVPGQGDSSAPTVPPLPTNTPEPTPSPTIKPQLGSTLVSPKDGMVMVYVPEGEFEMGDKGLGSAEKPVHTVYLDGFWIDQTEVTHELYKVCVGQGGCDPPSNTDFYDDPSYANHPIVYATWLNANNYCEWAGRRLPTEAEWEKAARGTDGRWYPWGNTYDCPMANFGECNLSTSPVGSRWIWQGMFGSGYRIGMTLIITMIHPMRILRALHLGRNGVCGEAPMKGRRGTPVQQHGATSFRNKP